MQRIGLAIRVPPLFTSLSNVCKTLPLIEKTPFLKTSLRRIVILKRTFKIFSINFLNSGCFKSLLYSYIFKFYIRKDYTLKPIVV